MRGGWLQACCTFQCIVLRSRYTHDPLTACTTYKYKVHQAALGAGGGIALFCERTMESHGE